MVPNPPNGRLNAFGRLQNKIDDIFRCVMNGDNSHQLLSS
jgi:hypothetical protein